LWQDFKTHVDAKLEEFIEGNTPVMTNEEIMESLTRLKDNAPGLLSCLDYLMAAADYQDFISLMLDFRDGFEWQEGDYDIEGDAADMQEEAELENEEEK